MPTTTEPTSEVPTVPTTTEPTTTVVTVPDDDLDYAPRPTAHERVFGRPPISLPDKNTEVTKNTEVPTTTVVTAPMALRTLRLHQSTSPKKSIASPKAAAGSDSTTAAAGRGGARGGTHPRTEEDDEETDVELCLICRDFDCQCPPVFVETLEAFRSP